MRDYLKFEIKDGIYRYTDQSSQKAKFNLAHFAWYISDEITKERFLCLKGNVVSAYYTLQPSVYIEVEMPGYEIVVATSYTKKKK